VASDPALHSFHVRYSGPETPRGGMLYLNTSPEFCMKRLLAAGSGPIYQVCKVFRDGEAGRCHNPEFTLLEWYRPGFDHHRLMDEVEALVRAVLGAQTGSLPVRRISYRALFLAELGLDPHAASTDQLRGCASEFGITGAGTLQLEQRDAWLDLLMSHLIQPRLRDQGMTFVFDYPDTQAALARVRDGRPPVAERFELFLGDVEVANGFHELTDAQEQRRRFESELSERQRRRLPVGPLDQRLLRALKSGLPDSSGVAVGLDRLLMFFSNARHIREVLAFPIDRA
jgi:lysyl-tRNA synthetase class 2